jgi:hypothetical protein
MFRFTAGIVCGVLIGRPIVGMVGRRVLPFVLEKTLMGASMTLGYIADRLDELNEKKDRRS